ncbi:hypothetical protein DENSPDRAFT_845758 [Dentipellis sp. KUC8613]|nr:hypothetical protein DENSPDRAFT_845758 [Dentipellis sp. KUC8613]
MPSTSEYRVFRSNRAICAVMGSTSSSSHSQLPKAALNSRRASARVRSCWDFIGSYAKHCLPGSYHGAFAGNSRVRYHKTKNLKGVAELWRVPHPASPSTSSLHDGYDPTHYIKIHCPALDSGRFLEQLCSENAPTIVPANDLRLETPQLISTWGR